MYLHEIMFGVEETSASTQQAAWIVFLKRMVGAALLYARSLIPGALSFFGLRHNPADNVVLSEASYPYRPSWKKLYSRTTLVQPSFFEAVYEV